VIVAWVELVYGSRPTHSEYVIEYFLANAVDCWTFSFHFASAGCSLQLVACIVHRAPPSGVLLSSTL